ncbi:MAG: nucleoside-diphosphate sugar epimerase/dehydratase, partial [Vicinamibacterales bacterium]
MAKSGLPAARAASRTDVAGQLGQTLPPSHQPGRLVRRRDTSRHGAFAVLAGLALFVLDGLALGLALVSAYRLRDITGSFGPTTPPPRTTYLLLVALATGATLVVFALGRMYRYRRTISRMDELYRIVSHVSLGLVIAIATASVALGEEFTYSRQMLVYGWAFAIVAVTAGRLLHAGFTGWLRSRGVAADRLLIVGAGPTGRLVLDKIRRSPQLGFDVVGFVRHDPPDDDLPAQLDGLPLLGMSDQLAEIVEAHTIDEVIVALSGVPHEQVLEMVYAVTHL